MRIQARLGLAILPLLLGACALLAPRVPPLPPGAQECIGLQPGQCLQLVQSVAQNGSVVDGRPRTPVGWRVRCTAVCNQNQGETEVTITWSDGTTEQTSMGWIGELAGPDGPVLPPGPLATPQEPATEN